MSRNLVIPSPSQPRRITGRLGKKIKRFIDKTNKATRLVNRGRACSDFI